MEAADKILDLLACNKVVYIFDGNAVSWLSLKILQILMINPVAMHVSVEKPTVRGDK